MRAVGVYFFGTLTIILTGIEWVLSQCSDRTVVAMRYMEANLDDEQRRDQEDQ